MYCKLKNILKNNLKWDINLLSTILEIGGLNNINYKVTYKNENYFIRICSENIFNLDRKSELLVLKKVSSLNLYSYPIYFDIYTGNMVTKWINAEIPTETQSNSPLFILKLTKKLKVIHNLNTNKTFNPFNIIRNRIIICKSLNLPLPNYIDKLILKLNILEKDLSYNKLVGFCHNDLNPSNILINSNDLYIVDFEFSGMGDIFFDLATISWLINDKSRKELITQYFGYYSSKHYEKLLKYIFVVKMFNATWSLLKSYKSCKDYDFINGAYLIFENLKTFKVDK